MNIIIYLYNQINERMRNFFLSIFLLLFACACWHVSAIDCVESEAIVSRQGKSSNCIEHHENRIIAVVTAANSCADLSTRPSVPIFSQYARRFRFFRHGCDDFFSSLICNCAVNCNLFFKITNVRTKECVARMKDAGYYVYALRRIIV